MASLSNQNPHPLWILGGDFNMITNLREKRGGCMHLEAESQKFRKFIHHNQLIDIPTSNGLHTWKNHRSGSQQITSYLDLFLISDVVTQVRGKYSPPDRKSVV